MIKKLVVFAVIGLLCSCGKKQAYFDIYKQPTLLNPAKMYLDVPYHADIGFFSDENCTLGKYGTRVEKDEKNVVFEVDGYRPQNAPFDRMQVVDIEAGVPQVVNITWRQKRNMEINNKQGFAMCSRTFLFAPGELRKYLLVFKLEDNVCYAQILDLSRSQKEMKPVVASGLTQAQKNCFLYEHFPEHTLQ